MKHISLILFILFFTHFGLAQCTVSIDSPVTPIDCDDCFTLTANGLGGADTLSENFNSLPLGTSWSTNVPIMFSNPCGPPPDGSVAAWFGNTSSSPRFLSSPSFDVSSGGDVCWEMKYATNGGNGSCEGPDIANEGVYFQYSIDAGLTWVSMQYYPPNGGYDPFMTQWQSYCVTIPFNARTTNTKFRWSQIASSGSSFDNWGIDNIVISSTNSNQGYYYDWLEDGTSNPADTLLCQNTSIENYNVIFTNGIDDTCTAAITMEVDSSLLIANFILNEDTICVGEALIVNGSSSSGAITYDWDFSGGTPSINTGVTSTSTFNNPGSYWVVLEVANTCGITDLDSLKVTVLSIPNIVLSSTATSICPNGSTNLSATGANSYVWSPNVSLSCSNCQNPVASPLTTTTYTVVGLNEACVSTPESITIVVDNPPLIADFVFDEDTICVGEVLTVDGSISNGAVSYNWNFNGGTPNANSGVTSTSTFNNPGSHWVVLEVTNICGFTDLDSLEVTVLSIPNITLSASDTMICSNESTNLSASGAIFYAWTPASSLSCVNCPDPIASPSTTTIYTVMGVNGTCNPSFESITIEVLDTPLIADFILQNDTVCVGETITFDGSTSTGAQFYDWIFNGATPMLANGENVSTIYDIEGTHTIQLIVENDCNETDTLIQNIVVVSQENCTNSLIDFESGFMNIYYNSEEDKIVLNTLEAGEAYILNLAGQKVIEAQLINIGDSFIETKSLVRGIYVIVFNDTTSVQKTMKFVK